MSAPNSPITSRRPSADRFSRKARTERIRRCRLVVRWDPATACLFPIPKPTGATGHRRSQRGGLTESRSLCLVCEQSPTGCESRQRHLGLRHAGSPDWRLLAATGVGGSIIFTSQYGTVNLSTLPVISRNGITQPAAPAPAQQTPSSVVDNATAPQTPQNVEPLSESCTTSALTSTHCGSMGVCLSSADE